MLSELGQINLRPVSVTQHYRVFQMGGKFHKCIHTIYILSIHHTHIQN